MDQVALAFMLGLITGALLVLWAKGGIALRKKPKVIHRSKPKPKKFHIVWK
jgi:hypothetical protein